MEVQVVDNDNPYEKFIYLKSGMSLCSLIMSYCLRPGDDDSTKIMYHYRHINTLHKDSSHLLIK